MNSKRAIGLAWVLFGLALAGWAIWGALTMPYVPAGLVVTWLMQGTCALLAAAAGVAFARGMRHGHILLRVVSILSLLYGLAWLLLGGMHDVPHYGVPLLIIGALSVYGLFLSQEPSMRSKPCK